MLAVGTAMGILANHLVLHTVLAVPPSDQASDWNPHLPGDTSLPAQGQS
jgi:hypothetical protein